MYRFVISRSPISHYRAIAVLLGLVFAVVLTVTSPFVSEAHAYASASAGTLSARSKLCLTEPESTKKKTYRSVATLGKVALRCGRYSNGRGWGYRKLVGTGRWNIWFDSMIGATLQSPKRIERDGTTYVFLTRWFKECDPVYRFRVVVQTRSYGTKKHMGIITTYQKFKG
jgi:hypothetical protein